MKILSMYLPQYHRVKENDEWWGEGYTDWISTRNGKALYEGHYQPHIPQGNYYYDLTDKKSLLWQAELMKKYGIDGQCIYHYWFKDGRKILEKPAEILLNSPEIDMPFCFSWANQSWANSWSAVKNANVWCDDRETQKKSNSGNGLLLEQQYGDLTEWKKHFDYLLPFFQDERYIKQDNKPVFLIYQALYIDILPQMKQYWNELAIKSGFAGIYFVGASNKDNSLVDEVLYPGPQLAMSTLLPTTKFDSDLRILEYEDLWKFTIENAKSLKDGTVGAFVGYDDSPRRGKKGCIVANATPELFKKYLTELIAINANHGKNFTFINAWNEWGEGMHLEPDEKWGESYLEAILYAKKHYTEIKIEEPLSIDENSLIETYRSKSERYAEYWRIFDNWMLKLEDGKGVDEILGAKGITQVIIYGLGMFGKHLVKQLSGTNIKISYGIDRKGDSGEFDFKVYSLEDAPKSEDAIIITATYDLANIEAKLRGRGFKGDVIAIDSLFK